MDPRKKNDDDDDDNILFIHLSHLEPNNKLRLNKNHINTFTAIVDLSRFNNSCLKSPQRRP